MSVMVVMLDVSDGTLHRPGPVHMRTACGVDLEVATVGPRHADFVERAARWCVECFPEYAHA